MTASGDLIVNGGTLAFTENGSWRNASSIVVNGDAKITVCAPQNFGRKSNLVLADENSLEVAEGVTVRVSSLTVGGAALRPGRYVFGAGTVAVGPFGFGIVGR